jgi:hypothetical protein
MNEKDAQNEQIESILRKAHLPGPSPELKERITASAKKAWHQSLPELPWLIPFGRLAASAAAAILIIWLANSSSDYTLARWRPGGLPVLHQQPPDLDILTETLYGSLVRHLVSSGRKPSMKDASALRSHAETVLRILDEARQSGVSKPPAPTEGRSRLFPTQSGFNSYS